MLSEKTKKIIHWTLTGLVALVFLVSASGKLTQGEEAVNMAASFGLDANTFLIIGIVDVLCLLLLIIPRTGILGTMLLSAYMGGAIATHLQHGLSIVAPCIIQSFLLMVAFYRFPELRTRLLNSKS